MTAEQTELELNIDEAPSSIATGANGVSKASTDKAKNIALEVISFLSAEHYEVWMHVGRGLKSEFIHDDEAGFDVFNTWSRTAKNYDPNACYQKWNQEIIAATTNHADDSGKFTTWRSIEGSAKKNGYDIKNAKYADYQEYPICNEQGVEIAVKYRWNAPYGKQMRYRSKGNPKGLPRNMTKSKLPLFQSQHLKDNKDVPVIVTEGEKAAQALYVHLTKRNIAIAKREGIKLPKAPYVVLGTVTGAAEVPQPEVFNSIKDRVVYLWPDNDKSGKEHMNKVAAVLKTVSDIPARILVWDEAPDKGDAADWVAEWDDVSPDLTNEEGIVDEKKLEKILPSLKTLIDNSKEYKGKEADKNAESIEMEEYTEIDGVRYRNILREEGNREEYTTIAVDALLEAKDEKGNPPIYSNSRIKTSGEVSGINAGDILMVTERRDAVNEEHQIAGARMAVIDGSVLGAFLDKYTKWYSLRGRKSGDRERVLITPNKVDVEDVRARYRLLAASKNKILPPLRQVVEIPTMVQDGTILHTNGYHEKYGIFVDIANPESWRIPENPTREDAKIALKSLYSVVRETKFHSGLHKAIWVSMLLTLVGRQYATGNIPMYLITSNTPGAGKGTLVDLMGAIAMGIPALPKMPPNEGQSKAVEDSKRLLASALAGKAVYCVDNQEAASLIGSNSLKMVLTTGTDDAPGYIEDRILGESAMSTVPWTAMIIYTGNNIGVREDLHRRTLMCRLMFEPNESPENKVYDNKSIVSATLAKREQYVYDCLTILKAYHDAKENDPDLEVLEAPGSYGSWSNKIRSAIAWADDDEIDVWIGNTELKKEAMPERQSDNDFLVAWYSVFKDKEISMHEFERKITRNLDWNTENEEFSQELLEAYSDLGLRHNPASKQVVNRKALGKWFSKNKDVPGEYVVRKAYSRSKWYVQKVGEEEKPDGAIMVKDYVEQDEDEDEDKQDLSHLAL